MRCLAFAISLLLFHNMAYGQRLNIADKAPDFEAIDTNGEYINLSNYKGQKVLIAFFRYAGCPVCNYRVHKLIENYNKIQSKGYNIIAVFEWDNKV